MNHATGTAATAAREFSMEGLEARCLLSTVHVLRDLNPAGLEPENITPVGERLFFSARGQQDAELWTSTGSGKGTKRVKVFGGAASSALHDFADVNGSLYFFLNNDVSY